MEKVLGAVLLIGGIVLVIAGFISGQSGPSVPNNVLGTFSVVTAVCVFGGAVTAFCGFALMAVGSHYRTAGQNAK